MARRPFYSCVVGNCNPLNGGEVGDDFALIQTSDFVM